MVVYNVSYIPRGIYSRTKTMIVSKAMIALELWHLDILSSRVRDAMASLARWLTTLHRGPDFHACVSLCTLKWAPAISTSDCLPEKRNMADFPLTQVQHPMQHFVLARGVLLLRNEDLPPGTSTFTAFLPSPPLEKWPLGALINKSHEGMASATHPRKVINDLMKQGCFQPGGSWVSKCGWGGLTEIFIVLMIPELTRTPLAIDTQAQDRIWFSTNGYPHSLLCHLFHQLTLCHLFSVYLVLFLISRILVIYFCL